MRIAIISDWFSELMGYSENCLPKAFAGLGHEVHVITSDAQTYFDSPFYKETYEPFIGPGIVPTGVKNLDGYTLHRLPHGRFRGELRIVGLRESLAGLQPDVVQTFEIPVLSTLEAAWAKRSIGYRLFLESHILASVFPEAWIRGHTRARLSWWTRRNTLGAFVNSRSERCYAMAPDAARLAIEWFGLDPAKVEVASLGVDTDMFVPPETSERKQQRKKIRASLGFRDEDIVCIYTGRFTSSKGPEILADAVDQLVQQGEPYRALFVGGGPRSEGEALAQRQGCVVHQFVPTRELPPYYWAAEIGVWPRQESTSMLDAAACGLPIAISTRVTARERVDGNGVTYEEGDAANLAAALLRLKQARIRAELGAVGAEKMRAMFSWRRIAEERAEVYAAALARGR